MQISCNVSVQSEMSAVVVMATNQTPVGINTYHKSYQKPDKERHRVLKQNCRHNVASISFLLFSYMYKMFARSWYVTR